MKFNIVSPLFEHVLLIYWHIMVSDIGSSLRFQIYVILHERYSIWGAPEACVPICVGN